MAHTYTPITVSQQPIIDSFIWNTINEDYDTWDELTNFGRINWDDWYIAGAWWVTITTPSATYDPITV